MTTNANMNPMQLMSMVRKSGNPQQFIYNMVQERMGNNPVFANLLNLAQSGRGKEVEEIARNMMKERGLDFDKEFNGFKKFLGL